jgi:mono/diheme cytochrome c family protein
VGRIVAALLVAAVAAGLAGIALGATNPAAGKKVYTTSGCGTCHAIGKRGAIGPDLSRRALAAEAKRANRKLSAFVRSSIVDPNAVIARGYRKDLMPKTFGRTLSKKQLGDLVAYLVRR